MKLYALFQIKIPNKRELIKLLTEPYDDFMKIYRKCTTKPYSFLVNDATLALDDRLRFRRNLLKKLVLSQI